MFVKPFKLKKNVQLKGSETKKLRGKVVECFPNVQEDELNRLLPNKSTVIQIKIITNSSGQCTVYAVDKRPIFFEDDGGSLIPTVYALWLVENLVPFFTTHPDVLPRLGNGADLMLPGVIKQGTGFKAYGNYKKDQLAAVNLTSNKSAVGVGRLARSSDDLYMSGGVGVCLKMLHVFGDKLWAIEPSVTLQIPQCDAVLSVPKEDDFPALGSNPRKPQQPTKDISEVTNQLAEQVAKVQVNDECLDIPGSSDNSPVEEERQEKEEKQISMDDVLKKAFFAALKRDGRKLTLPLLISNFYRLHVIPAAEMQIDLKRTSYKKISKFLSEMSVNGLIVVREEAKGIEKIVSIDFDHPDLMNFVDDNGGSSAAQSNATDAPLFHTSMMELYIITDDTKKFFSNLGYKKGDGLDRAQIKKLLKEYISKKKLPYAPNSDSSQIQLDPILAEMCNCTEIKFDDLFSTVLNKMFHTYEMRGQNEVKSGNKPKIIMSLATRSGNKKVTLVSNLESYGIIISEFAKACKLGVAASTSIIKSPHEKTEQLQVQGNQIRFIYNLLTETYKIKQNQIIGLELAKKEKTKKR